VTQERQTLIQHDKTQHGDTRTACTGQHQTHRRRHRRHNKPINQLAQTP